MFMMSHSIFSSKMSLAIYTSNPREIKFIKLRDIWYAVGSGHCTVWITFIDFSAGVN